MSIEERAALAAERNNLSKILVSYSIVAIMLLLASAFVFTVTVTLSLTAADTRIDKVIGIADKVISSFFPLVGAWVGTVVAFYFARDNFIVATQSAQALLRKEPVDPLSLKSAESSMIPLAKATVKRGSEATLKATTLRALLTEMADKNVSRLPLLFEDDRPFAVLHADRIRQFFAEKGAAIDQAEATLQTMLADPEYARWLPASYALVGPSTSLSDGWTAIQTQKMRMGRLGCRDALVTKNGKADEAVVGFLTDEVINRERLTATQ
ncbi:hypothetical protein [Enterovirga rhinocerotis]|uniref:hypothetical protein n=1 Tax=Enterovirga rhinocerotis TaxID=1339210 RepID=UPI001060E901|nr:hypothetical protein [Enterovirga rhinocerotis]